MVLYFDWRNTRFVCLIVCFATYPAWANHSSHTKWKAATQKVENGPDQVWRHASSSLGSVHLHTAFSAKQTEMLRGAKQNRTKILANFWIYCTLRGVDFSGRLRRRRRDFFCFFLGRGCNIVLYIYFIATLFYDLIKRYFNIKVLCFTTHRYHKTANLNKKQTRRPGHGYQN